MIPAIVAANEEPTEPLEPTRYPSSFDFQTSFCAIIYITAYPLLIIELSSLSSLSTTTGGRSGPYMACALL